jgi:hypothetical protein
MLIVGWVLIPLILGLLTRFGICCLPVAAAAALPVANPLTEHSQVVEIVEDGLHFKQSKLAAPELTNG